METESIISEPDNALICINNKSQFRFGQQLIDLPHSPFTIILFRGQVFHSIRYFPLII